MCYSITGLQDFGFLTNNLKEVLYLLGQLK